MILRRRDRFAPPAVLAENAPQRQAAQRPGLDHFALPVELRRREELHFSDDLLHEPSVLSALRDVFSNLCAVCGVGDGTPDLIVHRWRPAQGALDASGAVSKEHYFWLAYDWENLYLLCRDCSEAQGSKFPVANERSAVGEHGKRLQLEQPELLDPCADDAEHSLVYFDDGIVMGTDRRGQVTVDIFALNSARLVHERRRVAVEAKELCRELSKALDQERAEVSLTLIERAFATNAPFAAVTRQFVNRSVQGRRRQASAALQSLGVRLDNYVGNLPRITDPFRNRLRKRPERPTASSYFRGEGTLSARVTSSEEARGLRTVNISRVRIENFKGLQDLTLDLSPGVGRWTMLIGENGVGKTSILQAVALALSGHRSAIDLGVSPKKFTRAGSSNGRISIDLDGTGDACSVEFSRAGRMHYDSPFPIAVAAYGSTRLPHTRSAKRTGFKAARIQNLFDPHASLLSTNRWVPDLDLDRRASVLNSVHSALGLDRQDRLYFSRDGSLRLKHKDRRLGLDELSSGYQAVAALSLDLARIFLEEWESLSSAEGLVLLDEIEAHLHPRWQMKIVRSLRTAFPRVQFLATTHSPLCLRGLRSDEVRVMRTTSDDEVWIDSHLPPVDSLSADQILTSEHFGLSTTLDDHTQQLYDRYYRLLSEVPGPNADRSELDEIQRTMAVQRQYGATRRERMMLEVIDEFLAKERYASTGDAAARMEERTRIRLREIWEAVGA